MNVVSNDQAQHSGSVGDQQAVRDVIEAYAGKNTVRANGQVVPGRYRELFVPNRTDEGWKIAQYMFQPRPEQP